MNLRSGKKILLLDKSVWWYYLCSESCEHINNDFCYCTSMRSYKEWVKAERAIIRRQRLKRVQYKKEYK